MDHWQRAEADFDGAKGGLGLNIAHEAVDRHVAHGRGDRVALRFIGEGPDVRALTYAELAQASDRFAAALVRLGVQPGETVFVLTDKVPELYVAAFGTFKARAVFSVLLASFGAEPVRVRLAKGDARVLVTTAAFYDQCIAPIRASLPGLRHVIVIDTPPPDTLDYAALMNDAGEPFAIGPTDPEDPALLHFTSGTSGSPKGALHVHAALTAHHATATHAFGLTPDDVFWCTADPGWVMGSYGFIAPLTHGATVVVDSGPCEPVHWYRILQDQRVTVWYTTPTAIRTLMLGGAKLARSFDFSALRLIASAGEPLSPGVIRWGRQAFNHDIHNTWWQTETGAIMIATAVDQPVVLGAIGHALPGIEAAIARRQPDGTLEIVETPNQVGELVLRANWPSMFRGYVNEPEHYAECFADGWYLSTDLACRDAEGLFWFVSRGDEMIKSAGQIIGPTEVEDPLQEHPAVAEVAAIGKPDPVIGEFIKAFVILREGHEPGEELRQELARFASERIGPAMAPREIAFCRSLPKTRNGKILRRVLRARELGIPVEPAEPDEETASRASTPPPLAEPKRR